MPDLLLHIRRPPLRWLVLFLGLASQVITAAEREPEKRDFNLPAGLAVETFKLFSEQSGRGLIADAELVRDVRTNAVRGRLTVSDVLRRMLVGTGLVAREDPKNGAFAIHREASPQTSFIRRSSSASAYASRTARRGFPCPQSPQIP